MLVSLLGCGEARGTLDRVVRPELSSDPACAPDTGIEALTVEALPDPPAPLPPPPQRVPLDGATALDALAGDPGALRVLGETADGRFRGAALLLRPALRSLDATGGMAARPVLLPGPGPCVDPDPELRRTDGGAVAVLPDGGLLVAGGLGTDGVGTRRVAWLPGRGGLVRILGDDLSARRYDASAATVGDRVVVVGGAAGPGELGADTFEVWDTNAAAFDRDAGGVLCRAASCPGRVRPGVVPLGDEGAVLVAGGHLRASPDAEPVGDVAIVDASTGAVDDDLAPLPEPLGAPILLRLDDGSVWLLGGRDGAGRVRRELARFDPGVRRFVAAGVTLPSETTAFAALPGARILALTGGAADAQLVRTDDPAAVHAVPLPGPLPEGPLHAAAVPTGAVLVIGRRDGRAAGVWLDPGRGTLEAVVARRAPGALVALADGSILALDETGGVRYRPGTRHPLDVPPDSIRGTDRPWLAPDASLSFRVVEAGALEAVVAGARLIVPAFEVDDVALTLTLRGPWTVILEAVAAAAGPRVARLGDPGGDCPFGATPVEVVRSGSTATWRDQDGATGTCPLGALGRVRITLEAQAPGARFDNVRVRRR